MKKIEKEFLLSDDSVNCYGYRLLTSGCDLHRFNPAIGYLMHRREDGVAVKWEDLVIRDGALYGKPVVNEEAFPELAKQIEEGFYSAASVGHIVALEWSEEPSMMVEGQTGPTVTKWFPRECSIVDIPGNYNAVAQLYDDGKTDNADDDPVLKDLSANFSPIFLHNMNKPVIEVEALMAVLPNLAADSTPEQVTEVVRNLVAKAERCEALETELNNLKAEMTSLREQHTQEKVDSIVAKALADHKINNAMAEKLKADYKCNPDGLQSLVDAMPQQTMITQQLNAEVPAEFAGKSYMDLMKENKLEALKAKYPEYFKQLSDEFHKEEK